MSRTTRAVLVLYGVALLAVIYLVGGILDQLNGLTIVRVVTLGDDEPPREQWQIDHEALRRN